MMDPLWGLKRRQNEHQIVANPDHATAKNDHRSLKANITTLYGGETWKEICLLESLRIKIERRTADLQYVGFFIKIRDLGLFIPKSEDSSLNKLSFIFYII